MLQEFYRSILYLLNPRNSPSYWQTPSLSALGGSPLVWELGSLALSGGCLWLLIRFSGRAWFSAAHRALICFAPMFLGLLGTFWIAQLWALWSGLSPTQVEVGITLPTHVGIACTIVLLIASAILHLRPRRGRSI
jgi:hypothetical protein